MSFREAIGRLLEGTRASSHAYVSSVQSFAKLDVKALAQTLELERKAQERGARNEPSTSETDLDEVESQILATLDSEGDQSYAAVQDGLQSYQDRIAALDFESRFAVVQNASIEAVAEFRVEAQNGKGELHVQRRRLLEVEQERAAFRRRNRINRTAEYSVGGWKALKFGIIAVLFAAEVIMNAEFLSESNVFGIAGGFIDALLFSAINIGGTFILARYLIKQIVHTKLLWKLVGLIGICIFVAFAVSLNLTIAHYREISAAITDDVGTKVISQVLTSPLDLRDIKSWGLFGLGLLISIGIMIDVLLLDDPYPGYGKVERKLARAQLDYNDWRQTLVEQLKEIRDQASQALATASRDLGKRRSEYDSIVEARLRLLNRYQLHLQSLQRVGNQLLSLYRTANTAARTTDPPSHFKTWKYEIDTSTILAEFQNTDRSQQLHAAISKAQNDLTERAEQIHQAYTGAVDEYYQLDDLVGETGADGTAIKKNEKTSR